MPWIREMGVSVGVFDPFAFILKDILEAVPNQNLILFRLFTYHFQGNSSHYNNGVGVNLPQPRATAPIK